MNVTDNDRYYAGQKNIDSFEGRWGAHTKWKSSVFSDQYGHPTPKAEQQSSIVNQPLMLTDRKNADKESKSTTFDKSVPSSPHVKRRPTTKSKNSAEESMSRRLSFPNLLRSSRSSISSVFRGAKRTAVIPYHVFDKRGRPGPKPLTASKGTQTTPMELEAQGRAYRTSNGIRRSQRDIHPGNRVPTPEATTPSIVRRLLDRSSLSPGVRAEVAEDYFHHGDDNRRENSGSPNQTVRSTASSPSIAKGSAARSPSVGEETLSDSSADTSRVFKRSDRSRARQVSSDSTSKRFAKATGIGDVSSIASFAKPVSQLERLQALSNKGRALKLEDKELQLESRRKRSSPLQQEITHTPISSPELEAQSPNVGLHERVYPAPRAATAHLQLYVPSKTPGVDTDVPDHLPLSPLCPLHPRNKSYGKFACPQHGRLRDDDEEIDVKDKEVDRSSHRSASRSRSSSNDDSSESRPFMLNVPNHSPNSPLCPANLERNPDGRGVCVLHGRPQLHRSEESDESMMQPRAFILSR